MLRYLKNSGFSGQLLAALLVLTFSLAIAKLALARGDRDHHWIFGSANNWVLGTFVWDYPGCDPYPPYEGKRIIALKVPRDGNPDEVIGWLYSYNAVNDDWIIAIPIEQPEWSECNWWPGDEIPVVKVIDDPIWWPVGCPGSTDMAEGKVVLGAFQVVSASDPNKVGLYTFVWGLDGGRDGYDYFHVFLPNPTKCLILAYYYLNYHGYQQWEIPTNVVKGNLVIK